VDGGGSIEMKLTIRIGTSTKILLSMHTLTV